MSKCGKGCMPECEYFTTGGCISPFNCPYKIETGYINSATSVIGSYTQGKDDLNEPKIKKWFRSIVEEGKIQQEPMNYDAATLKIYIDHLEKENAELRERLEKAVSKEQIAKYLAEIFGNPCNFSPIDEEMYEFCDSCAMNDVDCWKKVIEKSNAEARLAELKGGVVE